MKAVEDYGWYCDLVICRDSGNVVYTIHPDMRDKYLESHDTRTMQSVARQMRGDGYDSFRIKGYSCRGAAQ